MVTCCIIWTTDIVVAVWLGGINPRRIKGGAVYCNVMQYMMKNGWGRGIKAYDLFGVVETQLGSEAGDVLVEVQRYSVLNQDRNTGGDGELLYVRNNLKVKILYHSKTTRAEKPLKPEHLFCLAALTIAIKY